jgi:hypothetical protein
VQRVGRENLLNMVGMGFGVTLAATSTQGASYPAVIFVPLAEGGEVFNSSVVWSTNNVNPALKRLLDLSASIAKTHQRRSSTVLAALIRDDVVLREINRWRQRAFEQAECLRCVYFIAWDREACGCDGGARTFSGTAALAMSGRA